MKKASLTTLMLILLAALMVTPAAARIDTPLISCGSVTQTSIKVQICGGPVTGAPYGFSLQWDDLADYTLHGWSSQNVCAAGFAGVISGTYNLGPGQCVTVDVGDLLFDNGGATSCPNALQCGTTYVFRAFGLAPNVLNRSPFTANLQGSTAACGSQGGCTFTQGYWRTHNPIVCITDPDSPLCIQWPVSSLMLGTHSYTVAQLVDILNTPAAGNGLISLAHQLIAADLNIANGADGSSIQSTIDAANTMIGDLVVPPVGSGSLPPSGVSALVTALDNYNSGLTGPGHCSSGE